MLELVKKAEKIAYSWDNGEGKLNGRQKMNELKDYLLRNRQEIWYQNGAKQHPDIFKRNDEKELKELADYGFNLNVLPNGLINGAGYCAINDYVTQLIEELIRNIWFDHKIKIKLLENIYKITLEYALIEQGRTVATKTFETLEQVLDFLVSTYEIGMWTGDRLIFSHVLDRWREFNKGREFKDWTGYKEVLQEIDVSIEEGTPYFKELSPIETINQSIVDKLCIYFNCDENKILDRR